MALRAFAPPARTEASLPLYNRGSAYQDYAGSNEAVGSAPAITDTGGDRMPRFPSGGPAIVQGTDQEIMPNGGERPVRSEAAEP